MAWIDVTWEGLPVARERPFAVAIVVWRTNRNRRESFFYSTVSLRGELTTPLADALPKCLPPLVALGLANAAAWIAGRS